jgi:uncharacterized membrane protein YphA (DoxX/SURF4 family)
MAELAYVAALLLAGVLAWAGGLKLAQPAATSRAFARLGVPAPRAAGRIVAASELGVAVALVGAPRAGALAAIALLLAFSGFVTRRLRSGVETPCACFGAGSGEPLSPRLLVRNGLLLGLAGAAVMAGTTSVLLGALLLALLGTRARAGALFDVSAALEARR